MGITDTPAYAGHDAVIVDRLPRSGRVMVIAQHLIRGGRAMGGCRIHPYASEDLAVEDALRLSEAMTKKIALAGLPYGGGKAVVMADPYADKGAALLQDIAEMVDRLGGSYVTAPDTGLTPDDMAVLRSHSRWVVGSHPRASYYTAMGVISSIQAIADWKLGSADLTGVRASVQGLGNVGWHVARALAEGGAIVSVTDLRSETAAAAAAELGVSAASPDDIVTEPTDFFVPCAMGNVITAENVDSIGASFVVGAANNQLAAPELAARLMAREVLWAPDFLVSAGGVIGGVAELDGFDEAAVLQKTAGIGRTAVTVLEKAAARGISPLEAADAEVELVLAR